MLNLDQLGKWEPEAGQETAKEFFVIITGYTGAGKPKFYTEAGGWTDSLASAKRISTLEAAQRQMLSEAFKINGGNVYKIEKVVTI